MCNELETHTKSECSNKEQNGKPLQNLQSVDVEILWFLHKTLWNLSSLPKSFRNPVIVEKHLRNTSNEDLYPCR